MTLPQAYALFGYWAEVPPVNESMMLAWFKRDAKPEEGGEQNKDFDKVISLPGVQASPNMPGGPVYRPEDVIRMAEEAKHGR